MNLVDVTGVTKKTITCDKEIGSLAFYFDVDFNSLQEEKISMRIERNGMDEISITKTPILLKQFLLLATFGRQAIASFPTGHYEPFKTVALALLSIDGNIELSGNDKLIIELSDLNSTLRYVIDGIVHDDVIAHESHIITYEKKSIDPIREDSDISVDDYYQCVMTDKASVKELNFTHKSKNVVKMTLREARIVATDVDPVAIVKQNGGVIACYEGYLQIQCSDLLNINVIKSPTEQIDLLFSKNVRMVEAGLIKA